MVEAVSGRPYVAWVRDEVLTPLNAGEDALAAPSLLAHRAPREVRYHGLQSEDRMVASVFDEAPGSVPLPYGGFAVETMDSHGGWLMSAVDLARLLAVLEPDAAGDGALLTPATVALMGTDPGTPGPFQGYGMGWSRVGPVWQHAGRLPGSGAPLWCEPARRLGFALLLNASEADTQDAFFADLLQRIPAAVCTAGLGVPGSVAQGRERSLDR